MDREAVWVVAETIAATVDQVLAETGAAEGCGADDDGCACGRPLPGGKVMVNGEEVIIPGLQMIFGHLAETGVAPTLENVARILETVAIYHPIPDTEHREYEQVLLAAYRSHCAAAAE